MKIKGIVKLVFRDKDTGKITRELEQENNITNQWVEQVLVPNSTNSVYNSGKFGPTIFISEFLPVATDPEIHIIPYIHAFGFVDVGVTSPTLTLSTPTTFAFGQFQQRFAPPATAITINTIGITNDTALDTDNTATAQAWVKLASPCTQNTNETLDIFYRIQFPYDYFNEPNPLDVNTNGISGAQSDVIAERLILFTANPSDYFYAPNIMYNGNVDFTRLSRNISPSSGQESPDIATGVLTKIPDTKVHKYSLTTNLTIDKAVGTIVGYIALGQDSVAAGNPWARGIKGTGYDVIQNIYGHSPAADKPFFDAINLNTGDGTMIADGAAWTNPDFPKLYKLNVTTSGGIGVGDYNFQLRSHFGTVLNTWKNSQRVVASLSYKNKYLFDDFQFMPANAAGTGWEDRVRPNFIKYDTPGTKKYVIAIKQTEICLLDLQTELGVVFNSTNFPTFIPTDITQVTFNVNTGDIYVGCRASGIYKIANPTGTPTVTIIDNTTTGLTGLVGSQCYGVSYGNNKLWAIFDGGLFSSIDDGTSWVQATFTNATITSNWSLVKCVHADPTHIDQRLGFVFESGGTTYMELSVLWWDETTSTDVLGLQFAALYKDFNLAYWGYYSYHYQQPWSFFNILSPSPAQNKWGTIIKSSGWTTPSTASLYPTILDFGNATILSQVTAMGVSSHIAFGWEFDSVGNECLAASTTPSTTSDHQFNLLRDNNTFESVQYFNGTDILQGTQEITSYGPCCYIGNMILLAWNTAGSDTISYSSYHLLSMAHVSDLTSAPFEHLLYDNYGWDGANWIKDNPGSKLFHAASETLVDGVAIAFDDLGATQTFVVNDYYTFGVVNGVWLDGGTEVIQNTGLYFKNIVPSQTDLEAATLSATIRSPEVFERTPNSLTWQDQNGVTIATDSLRIGVATTLYDVGARSIETISGTGLTNKSSNDTIHGSFTWGLYNTYITTTDQKQTCGLSPVAVIGTPINRDTIAFGIEIVGKGAIAGSNGRAADINIIESGVVLSSAIRTINTTSPTSYDFEIEILNDGSVNYYLWSTDVTIDQENNFTKDLRDLIYTSPPGTASIVDYYADIALNGIANSMGVQTEFTSTATSTILPFPLSQYPVPGRRLMSRVVDDLYIAFGDFATPTGRFTTNFFATDYTQQFDILIGGIAPTLVLVDDSTTVLAAGEISVFPRNGFIRYSGADAGKTITANYQILIKD